MLSVFFTKFSAGSTKLDRLVRMNIKSLGVSKIFIFLGNLFLFFLFSIFVRKVKLSIDYFEDRKFDVLQGKRVGLLTSGRQTLMEEVLYLSCILLKK